MNEPYNSTASPKKAKTDSTVKGASITLKNRYAALSHKNSNGSLNWQKYLQENVDKVENNKPVVRHTTRRHELAKKTTTKTDVNLTKVIAIDCEMIGIGEGGRESALARVSIVNVLGDCVYDKFVKPREKVTDYRTFVSGIREEDLKDAEDFLTVQQEVADILRGRILVGHSIRNDLEVLFLSHPKTKIRDTAKYFRKGGTRTPSLKTLAEQYLGVTIQDGEHNSVQDAKATVQLYNMYRKQWESGGGNRQHNRIDTNQHKSKKRFDPLADI